LNKILLFIIGKLKGYSPICDRCLDVDKKSNKISFIEYVKQRKGDLIYCEMCWNWIHLKHGTCDCGTYVTMRSKWGENVKTCPKCFNIIKLEINS